MQEENIPFDRIPLKDYTSFGGLVVNMYVMITFDNWPSFARPLICRFLVTAVQTPSMLVYFLPYVIVNLMFFMPIPIAVLFDSFRVGWS